MFISFYVDTLCLALLPFPTRRSSDLELMEDRGGGPPRFHLGDADPPRLVGRALAALVDAIELTLLDPVLAAGRSEEHTSELQSLRHVVCGLLLDNKKRGLLRATVKHA